jgi:fibronectin type 3 domain-containing protein
VDFASISPVAELRGGRFVLRLVRRGGMSVVEQIHPHQRDHTVMLYWQASTTKQLRYNIYRGPTPGFHPDKLNSVPIDGLSFTDTTAENGTKYYYMARAVNAMGQESSASNETFANVP